MKPKCAFTLIELLVVIAILLLIAGILLPVYASAKRSAKVSATLSEAHQLWVALATYRSDWDGEGKLGTASEMGLPPLNYNTLLAVAPDTLWKTECDPQQRFNYCPDNEVGPRSWLETVLVAGEAVPVAATVACTEDRWDVNNQFHPKLGLAATLAGTLLKKRRAGDSFRLDWWLD